MKHKIFSIFLILSLSGLYAQNVIERSQYWFNNNFDVAVTENIPMPGEAITFSESIPTSQLSGGLHTFHIRFQDNENKWSSIASSFFYKMPQTEIVDNKIEEYQYWFNNDFGNAITGTTTNDGVVTLDEKFDAAALSNGLHTFHIRFRDSRNNWSSIASSFFYKMPQTEIVDNKIEEYQYWFNNDFDNAATGTTASNNLFTLSDDLDASSLSNGLHTFHIRFRDSQNKWSSIKSSFFYKIPVTEIVDNKIEEYQYWFNNDFGNAVTEATASNNLVTLSDNLDASSLSNGLHTFHIRFRDSQNKWSSIQSSFFYKIPITEITDNKITNYRYWFGDDFEQATETELNEPVNPYNLVSLIDLKLISAGDYEIHFQFQDKKGKWSSVLSEEFTKIITPYASFTADNSEFCNDGTTQFSNNSVDADTYLWDFDDGNSSDNIEPVHYFENPGEYNVTLTASDQESGKQSTYSSVIFVYPEYELVDNEDICDGDVFTWRGNDYFETGTYYDSLITQHGCDSIYVLNLQVNPVYEFVEEHEICDGDVYSWHGEDYFEAGTYYAEYKTENDCDSVYVLNLKVNPAYEFVEEHEICDGDVYSWHGEDYVEAGTYYAEYKTENDCDSVYVLNLKVNPVYEFVEEHEICDGDVYSWHGNDYYEAGTYYADYKTENGCDSVYVLNLLVNPTYEYAIEQSVCENDFIFWRGNEYYETGIYYESYKTQYGCDSIYTLNLTVHDLPEVTISGLSGPYCLDAEPVTMTGNPPEGFFSGNGVSGNVFSPASAGVGEWNITYSYEDDNGCKNQATVSVIVDPCLGIAGHKSISANIYPNPTDGEFNVTLGDIYTGVILKVTDITGNIVYSDKMEVASAIEGILITGSTGMYFVTIISDQGTTVLKLLKQ